MGKRHLTARRRAYLKLRVAETRRGLKAKALAHKGGACAKCGYQACPTALTFHHRDPSQKSFPIGSGSTVSWERLREALEKCDLLCHNCHAELHYALTAPARVETRRRLDEYRSPVRSQTVVCARCDKEFRKQHSALSSRNFCSRACQLDHYRHAGWPSDAELLSLVQERGVRGAGLVLNKKKSALYKRIARIKRGADGA